MSRRVFDFEAMRSEVTRQTLEVRLRAGMGIPKDQHHDDASWEAHQVVDQARRDAWIASGRLIIHDRRHFELT